MTKDEHVRVADAPEAERYEVHVGDDLAGLVTYRRTPEVTTFFHTEVDERFEGRGLGSQLIRAALDGERRRGLQVEPRCPFVASYIRRHPDYADLVPEDHRHLLEPRE